MNKFKINTNKEPLTSEEISEKMDFDKFYSGYSAAAGKASRLSKSAKAWLGGVATTIVVVTATFMVYRSINNKETLATQAFIDPPLPVLNVSPDNFIIDNSKDTTIVYKTGTIIQVPANAFKHKDGKEAGKKVKICYREFRDPVDFIFSGIPMDYDSAGVEAPFESAGMFEVLGYENDSIPLYLKDGKTLNVNFLSDNDENKFNVYYLDTVAKQWNYEEHETRKHREDLDRVNKEKADFLAKHNLEDPNKLIVPKKANISLDNFLIDYNKEEFPELAVYEGVKFEVAASEQNYTSQFKGTIWEDVFISRHPDGKNYILTFKLKSQKTSITATPVFDEKNFEVAMKEYEKIRLQQARILQNKADSLAKLDQQYTSEEIEANSSNARFNAFVANGTVYRNIVVGRMGIWNYDQILKSMARKRLLFKNEEPTVDFPKPSFISIDNKAINVDRAFLVTRSINAVYSLEADEMKKFPLGVKNSSDLMIVISNDKKIFYVKDEELKKITPVGTNIDFKLKEIASVDVNSMDLDKIRAVIEM